MDSTSYQAMEKNTPLLGEIEPHEPTRARNRRMFFQKGVAIATLLFLLWWSYSTAPLYYEIRKSKTAKHAEHGHSKDGFGFDDFDTITPSEKLEWHKCFTVYKCARLTVPMDYNRPLNASKDNPKVHIAMILVPGIHTGSQKTSRSPLLVNPGGPGGSGFTLALSAGHYLQQLAGLPNQDIIGFDPRGIFMTTPRADCYSFPPENVTSSSPSSDDEDYVQGAYHRFLWGESGKGIGFINSSDIALQQLDSRVRSIAKLCQTKDELYGDDSILKYVSTPNVARDMLSIVDAWDEWTSTLDVDTTELDTSAPYKEETSGPRTESNTPYDTDTKGKLVYWGFSYGTMLGATFASMFPDRVGRMVLDGVVDADGFVGPLWTESQWDTNKNFDSFATSCHKAKKWCALYRHGDEVEDIVNRFHAVEMKLKDNPLTWIDETSNMPASWGHQHLRGLAFSSTYAPMALFPLLASLVSNMHEGIVDDIMKMIAGNSPYFNSQPFCVAPGSSFMHALDDGGLTVMCGDKRHPLNETIPNLEKEFEKLSGVSYFSDVYMSFILICDGYSIENKGLTMDWNDDPAHKPDPIKTSFPILFVSNSADPVTPLHAGLKMAKKFVDAGLIEQQSAGHCSLSAPSGCTNDWITGYFQAGIVPPHPTGDLENGKWVTCRAETDPWHVPGADSEAQEEQREATIELTKATRKVHEELSKAKFLGTQGMDWLPSTQELLSVYKAQQHCSY